MRNIQKAFGITVRKRRYKLGISQEQFAELADIDRSYVSYVELGKVEIGIGFAQKIAKGLKIPLFKLIRETERRL